MTAPKGSEDKTLGETKVGVASAAVEGAGAVIVGGVGDEVTINPAAGAGAGASCATEGEPLVTVTASDDPFATPSAALGAPLEAQPDNSNASATTTPLAVFTPI